MENNKKFNAQDKADLTDEELHQAAGGLVNNVGVVTNPCADMLGTPESVKPTDQKPNPFPQNMVN